MVRIRNRKWLFNILILVLVMQLSVGMSGIFESEVFADKDDKDKLEAPGNIQVSVTVDTVSIEWDAVKKADSYEIEFNNEVAEGIEECSYVFEGLTPDTEYSLKIRAADKKSKSNWSGEIKVRTGIEEPIAEETENNEEGATEEDMPEEITIDEETSGEIIPGEETSEENIPDMIVPDEEILSDDIESPEEFDIELNHGKGHPGAPENIEAECTDTTISLSWEPVEGAKDYEISINGKVKKDIDETEYTFKGLKPATKYKIKIRSAWEMGRSEWSKSIEVTTLKKVKVPQIPKDLSAEVAETDITLSWDAAKDAKSYDIEVNGSVAGNVAETEYTYGGIEPEKEYVFRVRSVNDSAKSEWSEELKVQTPKIQPIGTGNGLLGEYYDDIDFKDPVFTRIDQEIDFDWGFKAPSPDMDGNSFSIRWTGQVQPRYSGKYTFYTYASNGIRLWVDGKLIIDEWRLLFPKESKGMIELTAGEKYDIRLEYQDALGEAEIKLLWSSKEQKKQVIPQEQLYCLPKAPDGITAVPYTTSVALKWNEATGAESYDIDINGELINGVSGSEYVFENLTPDTGYTFKIRTVSNYGTSEWSKAVTVSTLAEQNPVAGNGNGLTGKYYDNIIFKKLILERVDRTVDFDWGRGTPDPKIKGNTFSVRWEGKLLPKYTAKHTIYMYSDDGAKLWINGKELIDFWNPHDSKEGSATIDLTAGEKYDIRIEYFNINKEAKVVLYWSNPYEEKQIIPMGQLYTKPDTPSGVSVTAEGSQIALSWDNTPGTEYYQLEIDGLVTDVGADREYIHEVLPNTGHKYRIRAVNEVSEGAWTEAFMKVSAPATPANLTAVSDTTNIRISWDAVEAAAGYDIEVDGSIIDNGNNTSYLHDGLNPNTQCTYRVRAKNENGIGSWTEMLTKTTLPATPDNISIEPTHSSLKLSWNLVDGAISYEIEADGQLVEGIRDTYYTFEGLAPDTLHTYKVRARNIEGAGYWSESMVKKTLLETPAGITSDITDRSVSLAWLPVNGATGYEVEIDGSSIVYTTEVAFTNEGLLPNSEHSYRIRAKNDDNLSEWSETTTRLTLPDIPKNLVTTSTSYTIAIDWEDIPGATSYDIEADGNIIASVADSAFIHEGLQAMTEYNYRVRAKSIAGAGYWSQIIPETTKAAVPANINTVSTSRTIAFTWDAVNEADRYEIELDGVIFNNDSETVYEYIELMPNSAHTYRVRAINEIGNGDWSELITKYTSPDIPGNIVATSASTSITLTWDEVEAAAGYDVEVLGAAFDNGNSTTYIQNGLNPNTQRTYRIRAKNENGLGDWSSIIAKSTFPGIPANLSLLPSEGSVRLSWDTVPGATGYAVEADGVIFENVLSNEYSMEGLSPNTQHSFRVRAVNEDGVGDWCSEIAGYTLPGAPVITVTEATDTTVRIAWEKADGISGYDVEADGVIIEAGAVSEYIHQNLLPNSEHTYRVRAKVENGMSNWSEPVIKLTLPDIPKNLKTTATSGSVELTWDVVEGAIEYEIEADGTVIAVVTDSKYLHEMLTPNTEHVYKIRAKSEAGAGNWSEAASAFTLLGMPENIKFEATSTGLTVAWDAVDGVTAYEIEADGTISETGMETKYEHTALMPNTVHLYRVRAKKADAAGDWSELVTANTLLASVVEIKAVSSDTSIALTWTPIGDAESYDVEVDGSLITGILEPAHKVEGLLSNTPHTFRVMAKSETNASAWSELLTKYTAPGIPGNITLFSTTSSITLTWEAVYGAVGYAVEVDGIETDNGANLSYLHENLTPNTQHIYKVRARNEYEAGAWSEAVAGTTEPELTFNCAEDNLFNFVLAAPKLEGAAERSITVTYNAEELEVVDFCAATAKQDIETGDIQGTNLEVKEFTPGNIVFSLKDPNKAIMNAVKFKAKINGQAKIQYVIE